jgi:hydroxypyruvate reductase
LGLDGAEGVAALAGDSDGIDGNSGASGAFVFGDTAVRVLKGDDPEGDDQTENSLGPDGLGGDGLGGDGLGGALRANDAASAFARIGDVFAPGPTGVNVNDLRLILISNRQA